jgi:hypothetical protein
MIKNHGFLFGGYEQPSMVAFNQVGADAGPLFN